MIYLFLSLHRYIYMWKKENRAVGLGRNGFRACRVEGSFARSCQIFGYGFGANWPCQDTKQTTF